MLDSETKRRIDTARDILVGKVPDPKSQVEQITIALIYKFMDDMDLQSVEMGGKRSFFKGKFEKYSWSNIFNPRLGGIEMLALYGEAITSMNTNANLPELFRNIFKNAYLPYRDPETLKLFLKTINEFTYDHSEKLGDAFEYLLSVLGSQGDAGQFRTPRHIIDFMVQVLGPKKNETVLDPACGTAGFLISAYKYILESNKKDPKGFEKPLGSGLTTQEKQKLYENFTGYDISPDMVRLSLVNLYLHGFVKPQIHEYDSLTSEERWNEYADVILANPLFMSPKGGILPHKKFSVQSNRSEVLFVDYMAEHLTPNGRAAIIVPEGIIFQSAGAYKQLRKYLIEHNYLWAVVSLPAGAFNPYSGVKTSILFLDKTLAKKTDQILFVKVEADGFDLGAQRRPIDRNDLPDALNTLLHYQQTLRVSSAIKESDGKETLRVSPVDGKAASFHPTIDSALLVSISRLAENEDYNLSADRYREVIRVGKQTFPLAALEDVFVEIRNGKNVEQFDEVGKYRVSRIQTISDWNVNLSKTKWTNDEVKQDDFLQEGDILLSHINSIEHLAKSALFTGISEKVIHGINLLKFRPDKSKILPEYAYQCFKYDGFIETAKSFAQRAVNQASLKTSDLKQMQIPLPPLETQRQIVDEIAAHQRIIDGARQVVEGWKYDMEGIYEYDLVELGDCIDFVSGLTLSIPKSQDDNGMPIISMNSVAEDGVITRAGIRKIKLPKSGSINYLEKGDLLFNWRNGSKHLVGKTGYFEFDGKYVFASFLLGIRVKPEFLDSGWLWYLLNRYRIDGKYMNFMRQNVNGLFNREELKILPIPLPPLEVQREIVARIESERKIVEGNRELIRLYEEKVKKVIARVWES
jgi:type I restriction enzyme M protein